MSQCIETTEKGLRCKNLTKSEIPTDEEIINIDLDVFLSSDIYSFKYNNKKLFFHEIGILDEMNEYDIKNLSDVFLTPNILDKKNVRSSYEKIFPDSKDKNELSAIYSYYLKNIDKLLDSQVKSNEEILEMNPDKYLDPVIGLYIIPFLFNKIQLNLVPNYKDLNIFKQWFNLKEEDLFDKQKLRSSYELFKYQDNFSLNAGRRILNYIYCIFLK